jgi:sugar phosphate isomerase/epimerase
LPTTIPAITIHRVIFANLTTKEVDPVTMPQITRRGFLGRTLATGAAAVAVPHFMADRAVAASSPQGWQIGIYTRPWASYDYRLALDGMVEAGFKYAGLMTTKSAGKSRQVISAETTPEEAAEVAAELKKRKLQVLSVYGGGIPVQKSLEAGIEAMRKLIDNCAAVGARSVLMGGAGKTEWEEPFYQAIAQCCDYAAQKGLLITLKPHGPVSTTGALCRERIEKVGKPNFRLFYDPGNVYFYSDGQIDPLQDAATVDGMVVGMCVKDYLDATGQQKKRVDVTPGTGRVNFPAVMARLKQGGFRGGPLVIECLAPVDDPKGIVAEAKKAREFVEKLVGA